MFILPSESLQVHEWVPLKFQPEGAFYFHVSYLEHVNSDSEAETECTINTAHNIHSVTHSGACSEFMGSRIERRLSISPGRKPVGGHKELGVKLHLPAG